MPARRPPRFLPFILTGAVLGFAVGGFLAARPSDDALRTLGSYTPTAAVGYLGFLCAGVGALLAALVALLVERLGRRD